ncbi:MAG: sugar nucleotide-binding protein, partial [Nitriliruptoraceae bacterium]
MNVLVTGATGQLGRALCHAFADDTVTAVSREDVDVTSEAGVMDVVSSVRPDVVVNAAAMTDVDACER